MRFINKRVTDEDLQTHLDLVQETLNSGVFIFIDLLFWAMFLTVNTFQTHHSIKIAVLIFVCFYLSGAGLFLLLRKWIKD